LKVGDSTITITASNITIKSARVDINPWTINLLY
jgi:hypothetical protein